jgi:hypothetical protein
LPRLRASVADADDLAVDVASEVSRGEHELAAARRDRLDGGPPPGTACRSGSFLLILVFRKWRSIAQRAW